MHPSVRTAAHMNTQSHARFWRRRWGLHTCRKTQRRTRRVKWASRPLVTPCVMHLVCSTCAMLCIHAALYTHIPTPPGVPRHEFAQSPIPWGNLQHMHTHTLVHLAVCTCTPTCYRANRRPRRATSDADTGSSRDDPHPVRDLAICDDVYDYIC